MNPLQYNPSALCYEVPGGALNDLQKEKVCLIEDLNKLQVALQGISITPKQFDALWETSMFLLRDMVFELQITVNRSLSLKPNIL